MPVSSWIAKIYALLARFHGPERAEFAPESWSAEVMIGRRRARLSEDSEQIRIVGKGGQTLYSWKKDCDWAEECRL